MFIIVRNITKQPLCQSPADQWATFSRSHIASSTASTTCIEISYNLSCMLMPNVGLKCFAVDLLQKWRCESLLQVVFGGNGCCQLYTCMWEVILDPSSCVAKQNETTLDCVIELVAHFMVWHTGRRHDAKLAASFRFYECFKTVSIGRCTGQRRRELRLARWLNKVKQCPV